MFRIGFACKWIDNELQINGIGPKDAARKYNAGTMSVAWVNRQTQANAEEKLWTLIQSNIESCYQLVNRVANLDPHLRMVRLGDILPLYTHKSCDQFYKRLDVTTLIEKAFAKVGRLARKHDVRLSFHPGQFCALASDNDDIVQRSVQEFEYHAQMAKWMGYGRKFQDLKINVHIAGRLGADGIKKVYPRLSTTARNCITIENEEMTHGLDECLTLAQKIPVVLDIHHNWIHTGKYINPDSDQVMRVIDSWRGIRPTALFR